MLKWLNIQPLMKTKICYVITKGNWGGAQKYVYTLATSLPKDRYDVLVIMGEGNILKEKLDHAGIRNIVLAKMGRDISAMADMKNFLKIFHIIRKEKPDILHLNSPKASGLGSFVGRLLFVPKIIETIHGWTFNEERGMLNNTLVFIFSWITMILCHKTIIISTKEEKQALAMPLVGKDKIVLIRNGIEKINFKEKNLARSELLSFSSRSDLEENVRNTTWFGTISELHKNKGLEYIIEAVSKIKTPVLFFIIGEGEERKKIEELIKKFGLENKVIFLGFLDKAGEYLKAFDIFTLTSIKEGLPYTILEAGLASLPVIASNVGGIGDIIDNSTNGILTTKTRSGEITRAIEYLIANPDKAKIFGTNLKQKIEKEFSVEQMLEKTINLYTN